MVAAPTGSFTSISSDAGSSKSDFYTKDTTLVIKGTTTAGATISVFAHDNTSDTYIFLGQVRANSKGNFSLDSTALTLNGGSYTLEAIPGIVGVWPPGATPLFARSLEIDNTAPTITAPTTIIDDIRPDHDNKIYIFTKGQLAIGDTLNGKDSDGNEVLTVTLAVRHGTIKLSSTSPVGVTVSQAVVGKNGYTMTLTGTADAINSALADSTYTTNSVNKKGGNVDDHLKITVVDQAGNKTTKTVNIDVTCFMPGTLIRTPTGEVAVESLKVGDLVLTYDGRTVPVNWLGRQTVSTIFANKERVLPIRIKAGALEENTPARDLLVSADHALLVHGNLIQAGALVNGSSIQRETDVPTIFTYYHVELDDHSLILAENTPAETFVDNVDRMGFDNWAEYEALYPDGKSITELPYPRAKAHRQVPVSTRVKLTERARLIGALTDQADVA